MSRVFKFVTIGGLVALLMLATLTLTNAQDEFPSNVLKTTAFNGGEDETPAPTVAPENGETVTQPTSPAERVDAADINTSWLVDRINQDIFNIIPENA